MSSSMRALACVVVSWAFVCHSRRVQNWEKQEPSSYLGEHRPSQTAKLEFDSSLSRADDPSHDWKASNRYNKSGAVSPLQRLSTLLLGRRPSARWHIGRPGQRSPTQGIGGRLVDPRRRVGFSGDKMRAAASTHIDDKSSDLISQLMDLRGGEREDASARPSGADAPRDRPSWMAKLKTYSISSIAARDARTDLSEVNQGNKMILPVEVLGYLQDRGISFEKFQLLNPVSRGLRLFTGPLEFSARSGECYLPAWVMKQLGIEEGEDVAVATANFPDAAFVKFQPHTSDFLDIKNHVMVLTRALEKMGGLTQGTAIRISDGKKSYMLDVLEVRGKPYRKRDDSKGKAVSIGLIECEFDFEKPKDMETKKDKKQTKKPAGGVKDGTDAKAAVVADAISSSPQDTSADSVNKPDLQKDVNKPKTKFQKRKEAEEAGEAIPVETGKGSKFTGRGRTLGGSRTQVETSSQEGAASAEPASELERIRSAKLAKKAAAAGETLPPGDASSSNSIFMKLWSIIVALWHLVSGSVAGIKNLFMPTEVSFESR